MFSSKPEEAYLRIAAERGKLPSDLDALARVQNACRIKNSATHACEQIALHRGEVTGACEECLLKAVIKKD